MKQVTIGPMDQEFMDEVERLGEWLCRFTGRCIDRGMNPIVVIVAMHEAAARCIASFSDVKVQMVLMKMMQDNIEGLVIDGVLEASENEEYRREFVKSGGEVPSGEEGGTMH